MILTGFSDRAESVTQFLTVLLVFLVVLALTYFTTRFVGNYSKIKSFNKNFEVVETLRITNGKYLQIVKVGSKYVCIGIGKDSITSICELSPDEVITTEQDSVSPIVSFKSVMDKARERIGKGNNQNEK